LRYQSRSEIKHCTFVTQGERHNYDPRLSTDPVCTISPSTRYRKIALENVMGHKMRGLKWQI